MGVETFLASLNVQNNIIYTYIKLLIYIISINVLRTLLIPISLWYLYKVPEKKKRKRQQAPCVMCLVSTNLVVP